MLFVVIPNVEAPYYYRTDEHYHQGSIWLCLYSNQTADSPSLFFGQVADRHYIAIGDMTFEQYRNLYERYFREDFGWSGEVEILPNENLTLSITGVNDRIYNSDIEIDNKLMMYIEIISVQIRFDGNGDGDFEYVITFPANPDWLKNPSIVGEPIDMTNGTIELVLSRSDEIYHTNIFSYSSVYTYFQVPFDLDTDNDGIGDFSDTDDDNDGHADEDDFFMRDPNEWKDSDIDGIGDNEDDNGNGIPDIFEIPIAVIIILIPFIIIMIIIKRKKKFKDKESDIIK